MKSNLNHYIRHKLKGLLSLLSIIMNDRQKDCEFLWLINSPPAPCRFL